MSHFLLLFLLDVIKRHRGQCGFSHYVRMTRKPNYCQSSSKISVGGLRLELETLNNFSSLTGQRAPACAAHSALASSCNKKASRYKILQRVALLQVCVEFPLILKKNVYSDTVPCTICQLKPTNGATQLEWNCGL